MSMGDLLKQSSPEQKPKFCQEAPKVHFGTTPSSEIGVNRERTNSFDFEENK